MKQLVLEAYEGLESLKHRGNEGTESQCPSDSIVRRKDEERWGEYRTKRLVLEYFDKYRGKMEGSER